MSLASTMRGAVTDLLDFLLPASCPLCATALPPGTGTGFCSACRQAILPMPAASCRRCALPYPTALSDDHLCGTCLKEMDPPFAGVVAAGIYDTTLKAAIHRFKYRDKINLDRPLAELLRDALIDRRPPDLIVPVPLHDRRLRQRTYNQSALLARLLAGDLARPLQLQRLVRHRDTLQQQGQCADRRRKNLRGAFSMTRPLSGEHVLLVDDVLTTGATARECGRVLLKNGAGSVTVAVLARARSL